MSEYKTLDSWFPDGKPDGRKFVISGINDCWFQPFYRSNSLFWYGLTDRGISASFHESNLFKEYTEPKKTKKVKMYKPVRSLNDHHYHCEQGQWCSNKEYFHGSFIVGWLEMEAEVEE